MGQSHEFSELPDFADCDDSGAQDHVVEPDMLAVLAEIGRAL